MSDTVLTKPTAAASPYTAPHKRAARKAAPKQFIFRLTICLDASELQCLNSAKLAFRSTEAFLVRMALDNFFKSQGLMDPLGRPINGANNG
jgi:hypothetical protein